jgi:hypothetical protein
VSARRGLLIVGVAIALAGCDLLGDVLGVGGGCASYNGELDGFQIAISGWDPILTEGGTHTLELTTTWLNNDLRRVPVNCAVDWVVEPSGVVEVEERGVVTAIGVGAATVTAQVTGSGGLKTASVSVGVVPGLTEVEPNNGMPAANAINDGQTVYGTRDYAGDEDWFAFTLAPGFGAQATLRAAIDTSFSWDWSSSYSGSVRDSSGSYVAGANQAFTHTGAVAATFYVRVSGSGNVPYAVTLDVFGP